MNKRPGVFLYFISALAAIILYYGVEYFLDVGWKWKGLIVIACFMAVFFLSLKRKKDVLYYFYLFVLPLNLDMNLFLIPSPATTANGLNVSLSNIAIVVLWVLWFLEKRPAPVEVDRRVLKYPGILGLFLALSVFSMINAKNIVFPLYEIKRMFFCFLGMLYVFLNLKTRERLVFSIITIFGGIFFHVIFAMAQYIIGANLGIDFLGESQVFFGQDLVDSTQSINRVSGLFAHANMYATYLTLLLPVTLSLSMANIDKWIKNISFLSFCVGILSLILTFSRGGLLSSAFSICLFILIYNVRIFRKNNKAQLIVLFTGALTAAVVFGDKILMRFFKTPSGQLSVRYLLNDIALKMIAAHPVIGVGLNNYCSYMRLYDDYAVSNIFPAPVHNVFLLVASETGVVSLFVILIFVAGVMKESLNIYLNSKDEFLGNLAIGIFCGILGIFVHNMVDAPLRICTIYHLFFMMCTIVLAIRYNFFTDNDRNNARTSVS